MTSFNTLSHVLQRRMLASQ